MTKPQHLIDRIQKPGPKRILSLDGGGIRGALTLGFLEKIEELLSYRFQKDDFRLCDYYDLIGGTSTGSIIASGLAIGMRAKEIKQMYLAIGGKIFGTKYNWYKYYRRGAKYSHLPLEEALQKIFNGYTLGDQRIKSLLCIVTKRVDTYSTWPVINNPLGKYYDDNKDIPLWELIRASTAAPSYFEPKIIRVNALKENIPQYGAFIDGGVSSANNPSFQLFLLAQAQGYRINWNSGKEDLFITSIGTGTFRKKFFYEDFKKVSLLQWGKSIPNLFMEDASYVNQSLLQFFSNPPNPVEIDGELGDLDGEILTDQPLLSYLRYNAYLTKDQLDQLHLSFRYDEQKIKNLREMDQGQNRHMLAEIGENAARQQVLREHFPEAFDI